MGLISIIGKIVLVLTNLVLLLLSLGMIVVGILIVTGNEIFTSLVDTLEKELQSAVSSLGTSVDTSDLSLTEFFTPVAYALIGLGVLIGAMSLLGCIGACYTVKIILIVYVIVTSVLFVVQVVAAIVIYADKSTFDKTVKPHLKDTLSDYAGIQGTDAKTLAWNALMNYEKCCGLDDYTDFHNLTSWPAPINGQNFDLKTPVICCKTKTTDRNCTLTPTDATNNWKTGCYDKLFDMILNNSLVLSIIIVMIVAQFVLIFFAIWILCTMNNKIDII